MADLKTDDFATARRPSPSFPDVEKGGFRPRSAAASPLPARRPALDSLPESVTRITNNAPLSILAYCLSSISMTIVNKYVVSGRFWNLTFFYLTVQVSIMPIA
jgi:GDP-mannose transporter